MELKNLLVSYNDEKNLYIRRKYWRNKEYTLKLKPYDKDLFFVDNTTKVYFFTVEDLLAYDWEIVKEILKND